MNNIFNKVFIPGIKSSVFDLSHDVKTSFSMGELTPITVMDTIPGDRFSITPHQFLRFMPLVAPVMHKVNVNTRYFFVPNRIMWSEWDAWISGNSDVEAPYITLSTVVKGSLMDYLGYPVGDFSGLPPESRRVSPLPIVAYLRIWNEWFRDQNLQDEFYTEVFAGVMDDHYEEWASLSPPHVNWKHDYFTAALPFAQKGPDVQIPISIGPSTVEYDFGDGVGKFGRIRKASDGTLVTDDRTLATGNAPVPFGGKSLVGDGLPISYDPNGTLTVDPQASAGTLNDLRTAWTLQAWLERSARVGTRIWEMLKGHFGVTTSDARIQRPEYLGGTSGNMVISEVLATAENTEAVVPVGQMAGHGISVVGGNTFRFTCEEHGWVIGLIFVRPETAYAQGLERKYTRFHRFDHAWPLLANLGEQPVKQREVYALTENPEDVFGYLPAYEEYRFENNKATGEMRPGGTLDYWNLTRDFITEPVLDDDFIRCSPDTRIFAVTDPEADHIVAQVIQNITVLRKLPRNGIPATIG